MAPPRAAAAAPARCGLVAVLAGAVALSCGPVGAFDEARRDLALAIER